MPPKKRARFNDPETVYASRPPLRQEKFPSRSTRKRIPAPSPPPTIRQQTMTQAGFVTTIPSSDDRKRRIEQVEDSQSEPESGSEIEGDEYQRLLRQTTLTQLRHGVQPLPGNGSDNHKAAARRTRRGMTEEEKRQQTLTQMIGPGVTQEPYFSYNGEKEQEDVDKEYAAAIEQCLAENGSYQPAGDRQSNGAVRETIPLDEGHHNNRNSRPRRNTRKPAVRSNVDASTFRRSKIEAKPVSTPRTKRSREIPSSQSPPDSPLRTQNTPKRTLRSPLKERSPNMRGASGPDLKLEDAGTEISPKIGILAKDEVERKASMMSLPLVYAVSTRRIMKDTIPDTDDEDEESDEENAAPQNAVIVGQPEAAIKQIDAICAREDSADEREDPWTARSTRISETPTPEETEDLPVGLSPQGYGPKIKQEPPHMDESQQTAETGTEQATAQLHSELETYTQRVLIQSSCGRAPTYEEQPEQRIPSSFPLPTESSHPSQASTVDETQNSPHGIQHSRQTLPISPTRPPPLSIPSSIPNSPFKSFRDPRSQAQDFRQMTNGARGNFVMPDSLDDFSIPLPPRWDEDD